MKKLKSIIRMIARIIKGEPVRSWRKLENGKYICDGDCGRWSMHGVCTCGLCHYFKFEGNGYDKIERDNVSWRREGDTEYHMHKVPRVEHCDHGIHLNENCSECKEQMNRAIKSFMVEWNTKLNS